MQPDAKRPNFSPQLVNMTFFQLFGSNKVPAFTISATWIAGEKCHPACEVWVAHVTMSQLFGRKDWSNGALIYQNLIDSQRQNS